MSNELPKAGNDAGNYYASAPYQAAFDIGYPQENLEGEMYKYRCKHCKIITTDINGILENHAPDCEYRLQQTRSGAK